HGRGVFVSGRKVCGKAQMSTQRSLFQRKTVGGLEKGLETLSSRSKIRKRPITTVDKKPNGKSRIRCVAPWWAGLYLVFAAASAAAGDELSFPELPATITLPHIAARPGPLARGPEKVLTAIPHFDAR